jgi:hypothetical protein
MRLQIRCDGESTVLFANGAIFAFSRTAHPQLAPRNEQRAEIAVSVTEKGKRKVHA